jgi:hypothetical protein
MRRTATHFIEERMTKRTGIWAWFVVVVLLITPLVGCSGDGGSNGDRAETSDTGKDDEPIDGSFVGQVSGTKAFIAIVAAPAQGNEDTRRVQVFISDGRRLSESFSGTIRDNSFVAESADGDAEARGDLGEDSVTGTVELPDGKKVSYKPSRPGGASGFYDLAISAKGKLSGVSAAGLGVAGRIELVTRTGVLRLADGRRVRLDVDEDPAADLRLRAGQVRLIILPGGEVAGAGKSPLASEGGSSVFFIRSRS